MDPAALHRTFLFPVLSKLLLHHHASILSPDDTQHLVLTMDYLRNLGSAAVSTLVQKSGINLPFTLGPKVASCETLWALYDATKRVLSHAPLLQYELTLPVPRTTEAPCRSLNTISCTRSTSQRSRSPRMRCGSYAPPGILTCSNSWMSSNRRPRFSS